MEKDLRQVIAPQHQQYLIEVVRSLMLPDSQGMTYLSAVFWNAGVTRGRVYDHRAIIIVTSSLSEIYGPNIDLMLESEL